MSDKEISGIIKSTVHAFLPDARVLLFGSRALGNFNENSDFDLLIITKNNLPDKEKISWAGKIRKSLINTLHAPFDVILNSDQEVERKKEYPGHIIRWAMKDGVFL